VPSPANHQTVRLAKGRHASPDEGTGEALTHEAFPVRMIRGAPSGDQARPHRVGGPVAA